MGKIVHVLIADDHPLFRKGIRTFLETEPGIEIVGEAQNGEEAISFAMNLKPDLILMDLEMPCKDGITAINEIRLRDKNIRILVLTCFSDTEKAMPALKAGANGYLLKDSSAEEVLGAIYSLMHGIPVLNQRIQADMLNRLQNNSDNLSIYVESLTERELEVLRLIAQGATNQEVAEQLVISKRTVSTHINNILSKLQLKNRAQAVLYSVQNKIINLPTE